MRVQEIRLDEQAVKPGRRRIPPPPSSVFAATVLTIPVGSLIVQGYAPAVGEFSNGTIIYVNGADVSKYKLDLSGAFYIRKQTIGRGNLTIDFVALTSSAFVPAIGNTI